MDTNIVNKVACGATPPVVIPPAPAPIYSGSSGSFAILPLIDVIKIPSPLALPQGAGPVTYTYTVKNIGKVPMIGIGVKDNLCSPITYVSGNGVNNPPTTNSSLDIGKSWIFSCTKTVSKTETNTATAHGQAGGWDTYHTTNATVVVGASTVPPLIHVVKIPDVSLLPVGGGAVTYTYTVTNPGTVPLSDVSITDNKCTGLPTRISGHPGDVNHNDLLDPGEIWTFTCQTNLTQTTTNVGTAEGDANGLTAIDFAQATVAVLTPSLPNTGFGPMSTAAMWNLLTVIDTITLVGALGYLFRKQRVH